MLLVYKNNMENNKSSYIKTDENKFINEKSIIWVKKMSDCLEVCTRPRGCTFIDSYKICKINNPDSYDKLNNLIDQF
jgi:hypothetical protein